MRVVQIDKQRFGVWYNVRVECQCRLEDGAVEMWATRRVMVSSIVNRKVWKRARFGEKVSYVWKMLNLRYLWYTEFKRFGAPEKG